MLRSFRNYLRKRRKVASYLIYRLQGEYAELPEPQKPFYQRYLSPAKPSLFQVAHDLRMISEDPRVKGIILEFGPFHLPFSSLQSLRDLLVTVRNSNKEIICWAKTYNIDSLYLSAVAHQVLLQPGGSIEPLGLVRSYPFFKDALDQLGLAFQVLKVSPFKSAADIFTRNQMSPEVRKMANWLLDSTYQQYLAGLGKRYGNPAQVEEMINQSPYTDEQSAKLELVDNLVNQEDIQRTLRLKSVGTFSQSKRALLLPRQASGKKYIALIRIQGDIVDGWSQKPRFRPPLPIPFLYRERAGDATIVQQLRRAECDTNALAVVIYVNSGGGSATASEAIHSAVKKLASVKPTIVQMGPVAASGGYYIASAADHIFAQPATVTGSIGVVMGKFVDNGFLQKVPVKQEVIVRGDSALFYSFYRPFSEPELCKAKASLERTYQLFLQRVAEDRNIPYQRVVELAGGRVWTGKQAVDYHLVDELGGLTQAIAKAKELAKQGDLKVKEVTEPKRSLAPLHQPAVYLLDGIRRLNRAGVLCICTVYPLVSPWGPEEW